MDCSYRRRADLSRPQRAALVPRTAKRNTVPGAGLRQLFCEDPNGVMIEINVMRDPGRERQGDDDGEDE